MKLSDVDVGSPLKSIKNLVSRKLHSSIAFNAYLVYKILMNKFEFKNLVKNLEKSLKERSFFKNLRKEVNTGANGTQDYVVKKGINKNTVATTRQ